MYYAIVAAFMFGLPILCIGIELAFAAGVISATLVAKWFVFWSVGVRLFTAGLRQIIQPEFTANVILGFKSSESLLLVRELGFSNLAVGLLGILSLMFPQWRWPVALAGGVFYGLAGLTHVIQDHRNTLENVAMVSDLFVSAVLLVTCCFLVAQVWATRATNAG
jgi:hypothetical protein